MDPKTALEFIFAYISEEVKRANYISQGNHVVLHDDGCEQIFSLHYDVSVRRTCDISPMISLSTFVSILHSSSFVYIYKTAARTKFCSTREALVARIKWNPTKNTLLLS